MALTSNSSLAQVTDAYDDNASYSEDHSVVKARAFATACRILIRRTPASGGGPGTGYSERDLSKELAAVEEWLGRFDTRRKVGPSVTLIGHRNVRRSNW